MEWVLATLLSAAPLETASLPVAGEGPRRPALQVRLDFAGFVASSWFVPESRSQIEAALENARGSLLGEESLDGRGLLRVAPVIGPWLIASRDPVSHSDRAFLVTAGLLQLVGLWVGALQLSSPGLGLAQHEGPVLSISPLVGGSLGLSLKIRGI